jgi:hypothetical protein
MSSILQVSPLRVMTYAVVPTISSEVGRSRPSATVVNVPSAFAFIRAPIPGSAGEPAQAGSSQPKCPCERA